ncbi:alpha/beta fold hydrolase [Mycolicibacter arupensis]|jgi:pimeloyl-ACP methyl ester carboxylesterase|uniref:Alpha/beta hydrolase n=1 Tax=Mycolicibacter arupensis TaxID=342002 RepID=A0A5C7Y7F2_9MYCO|nr:alpha/beta hydrolase [Mycolicibacter arupensis]MCV7274745.1 alpha/beta hydrolase [Mycolicibacter arupensis]TXI57388.1 MAG: alpha/beta hydrolase [Mycolicibacter arupensis]
MTAMTKTAWPNSVREWQDGGRWFASGVGRVFVRSASGEGPTVLLLHGFPSCSYDFRDVVARLDGRSWLTMDFLGFGLSDKPHRHRYSLFEQADLVEQVVAASVTGPVVLAAHDMGTSVATELLARDLEGTLKFDLQRAVLTNGSVILERASLRPIQKVLRGPFGAIASRLTNRRSFVRGFGRLFSPQHPLTPEEADAQWALLTHNGGNRNAHRISAYLDERVQYAQRWHGAVRDWPKPLGFVWGLGDPVATTNVLAGLRELRPAAGVVELPGLGHYPQIEDPQAFTDGVLSLLV